MLGPIDYLVVGFKGNNFDGSILEELSKAAASGAIRVVDLLFIIKYADGTVDIAEIEDQDEELRESIKQIGYDGDLELISMDDAEKIAEDMDNDTSAGLLIIEQLWAKGLKKALLEKDAILIDEGRIHPDKIAMALDSTN
jgi:hypothetical protein